MFAPVVTFVFFFFLPLQFYELKFAFQVESEDVFTELEEVNKVII